jgi:uncharacterized protein YgiB involved in biofilm formation
MARLKAGVADLLSVGREPMPGCGRSLWLLAAVAVSLAVAQTDEAQARPRKVLPRPEASASASFADERDCVAKAALEASECHNAAFNSHAEYEEKAPRLDSNEACTRFFGAHNCSMRIGGGLKGIAFIPSYKGFRLVQGKAGSEVMTLPLLAGSGAGVEFAPRPVTRLDTKQDAGRGARAQAAWQGAHAPAIRSAGGGATRYREAPKGAAPDLSEDGGQAQPGPAATYPVNPAMLKAMQEEMRKYGTPPK